MIDLEVDEKKAEKPSVYVFLLVKREIVDGVPQYRLISNKETGEPYPAFGTFDDANDFRVAVGEGRCGVIQLELAY